MSEDGTPTISVTRGRNDRRGKSNREAASASSWLDPMSFASRAVQGARSLWLAGLGVLSVAEETGTQVFEALVAEGKSWEQRRREQTQTRARQVRTLANEGAQAVEAVEARVQQNIDTALQRLGVPRRRDLDELRGRVNDLAVRIERLADAVDRSERNDAAS